LRRESGIGNRKSGKQVRAKRRSTARRYSIPDSRFPIPNDWWASYFDAQYLLEYSPIFDLARDRREVARLIDLLGLPTGARILDVPCGQGRHAHLLAEAGYDVDGLDAVVNLFTSFGFFLLPRDDERVVAEWSRVLKPGGVLVWHGGNRDGVMRRFVSRDWWLADDDTMIGHERSFDALSGVLTVRSTWRGRRSGGEREHRMRLYSASHLAEILARHGLVVEAAFDGWTERALSRRSGEMLLVARKDS